jgi:hypothetical protein
LRPRAGADGVDHAAGGQADHAADDRGGNHHDHNGGKNFHVVMQNALRVHALTP